LEKAGARNFKLFSQRYVNIFNKLGTLCDLGPGSFQLLTYFSKVILKKYQRLPAAGAGYRALSSEVSEIFHDGLILPIFLLPCPENKGSIGILSKILQ